MARTPQPSPNPRRARLHGALALALAGGCYTGAPEQDDAEASTNAGTASDATSASASASASAGDSSGGGEDTGVDAPAFAPGLPAFPRLTQAHYFNSVRDLLGPGLPTPPLEPDTNPYLFFTIGAASTTLSENGAQLYEEAADLISRAVFDDPARREALLGCVPAAPGDGCVAGFITAFGRRAFRRPLGADEQARWLAVATDLADGDPWRGVQLAVAGMLQSPNFLYRVELGEPDPRDPTRHRYSNHEIASRLSYLLWNTTPDDLLLDAADAGELVTDAGIEAQAERLLADPRSRAAVQDFFAQFLDLGRLDGITRDPALFPLFTPTLAASARAEIDLLIDDLVYRRDTDVRQLFSTRHTFVNSELAALYGLAADGATPITFVPVDLPEDGPRAGLLTLAGFLLMNSHETETSPTRRGKYVRERVLCQPVPPPPDNVDTNLPDDGGEAHTLREKLEEHRANPTCAGCHAFIDPPGFLFETFDEIGNFRTHNRGGYELDASGDLDGIPLTGARDLADLLVDDVRVGRCMITQLFRHTSGRLEADTERIGLQGLDDEFAAAGFRFRALLVDFIKSELFRTVAIQEVE